MHYADLPPSEVMTRLYREGDLTDAISTAVGSEARFARYDIAGGGASSCRVFLTEDSGRNGVDLPPQLQTPEGIARELLRYTAERGGARYPERPDSPKGHTRGWEIGTVMLDDEQILVATAVWVETID